MARYRGPVVLVAALAATVLAGPVAAQVDRSFADAIGPAIERSATAKGTLVALKDHECVFQQIACGQTITSSLGTHDCQLEDDTFYDLFDFSGQAGQTVTVTMSSNAVDAYLFLLDPPPDQVVVAEDDNGGGGTDARLVHTLDQTSTQWTIVANALDPFDTGPYTLSLQCSGGQAPPPPPDGFFADPNYPDFHFRVTIGQPGDTRPGTREPSCQPETVCVSGAVPGRSEAFLRILGPRPNGFLWPTIVRFTPSRLVVEMRQLSTGQTRTYVLPAVPPGTEELLGLQDRTGFQP